MNECRKITFSSREEAKEGIRHRGITDETVSGLFDAVRTAADEIVREYDLEQTLNDTRLERDLQIGYAELVCHYLDEDIQDETGLQELIEDIRENPIENSYLVLGRMSPRSRRSMLASEAIFQRLNG